MRRFKIQGNLVLHWGIVVEVMDALSAPKLRLFAKQFWNEVHAEPDVVLLPLTDALLSKGADLHGHRPDKAWSLTDCISFVIMQDRGIQLALSGDKHFEQAGFEIAFP